MLRQITIALTLCAACAGGLWAATGNRVVLPSGWRLTPPQAAVLSMGTMPQGIALSPNGSELAVVESGVPKAALRIIDLPALHQLEIPLAGAFGKPVWLDNAHVAVAGANGDAIFTVAVDTTTVTSTPTGKGTWPVAVAPLPGGGFAIANDGTGTVLVRNASVAVGAHPSDLALSRDGKTLYAAVRQTSSVAAIDIASQKIVATIPTGLHPAALALSDDGNTLYVAESDDDSIGVIDTRTNALTQHISVGLHSGRLNGYGASPNALLVHGGDLFVSLGAENDVALVRGGRVVERIPAGWYPTGVAMTTDGALYVANGKGEGAPSNPQFDPEDPNSKGYVGDITVGSLRVIPPAIYASAGAETQNAIADAAPQWTPAPAAKTVLRANGPIKHVIYIIKENRSYDQVLGDIARADGDPKLVMFGRATTPNQHALAQRFGIFDNAYTDAQVSANGHNWTDAGFANDYVERFWPPNYGGRRDTYDFQDGSAPDTPHGGYLWDAAKSAHLTYRDYGENILFAHGAKIGLNTFPGLAGHFDEHFVGWDLRTSDEARLAEWMSEFKRFVAARDLPQLEIVYFPNDHTAGTHPGMPTPQAYVAINDWAVGRLIDTVSHSPYWKSTAIFVLEDDAQNGPDHVNDQRSTFYIASPYARGGVQHGHYSTAAFVHTIELILGLHPLSIYDATAQPLYDAFATSPLNAHPYTAIKPGINMQALNTQSAYGAAVSAKLDFSHPDEADPRVLNDILEHAVRR
jgi:YVTN family beta-propeller protein